MSEYAIGVRERPLALAAKQQTIAETLERFRQESVEVMASLPEDIQRILQFVHAQLFDPTLTVGRIRSLCQIRNNNASTQFRLAMGLGIREYIEALRLDLARRLLQERRFEIYLIAMAVGYECQETFCRAFKRRFGCTASACRPDLAPQRKENVKVLRQESPSNQNL